MPLNPPAPVTISHRAETVLNRWRVPLLVTIAGVAAAVMAGPEAAAGVLVGAIVAYLARGAR